MLRFNYKNGDWLLNENVKFQYILCYGSTFMLRKQGTIQSNFNTSYVTVQHDFD